MKIKYGTSIIQVDCKLLAQKFLNFVPWGSFKGKKGIFKKVTLIFLCKSFRLEIFKKVLENTFPVCYGNFNWSWHFYFCLGTFLGKIEFFFADLNFFFY